MCLSVLSGCRIVLVLTYRSFACRSQSKAFFDIPDIDNIYGIAGYRGLILLRRDISELSRCTHLE